MTELLEKLHDLNSLPSDLHWFCDLFAGSVTQDIKHVKSEHTIGEDLALRRDHVSECMKLFAFDGDEALQYQDQLAAGIEAQLSRCDLCIVGYYKSRQQLIEKLQTEYDDEEVSELVNIFNARDIARIKRGLNRTTQLLQRADPADRHKNMLDHASQLALFEALCSEGFLADEKCLRDHFQEPFRLVQTNKKLKINYHVPAATKFLFDRDPDRFSWALYTWSRLNNVPDEEDFRFAVRNPLSENLQSVFEGIPDMDTFDRLWCGLSLIIGKLDNNLVTHSLRAMDIDIFKLALEHLKYDTEGLRSLVRAIQELLEIAPKDFWDAMGAISPTTFIEQIFNNPRYDRYLERAEENEEYDLSALKDMLVWVKPFMASLETVHQARACRSLTFQLLNRLQADRFPPHAKLDCKRIGLATLAWTLSNCNKEGSTLSHTGRVVAAETLEVASDYIKDIFCILSLPSDDEAHITCAETCLKIIRTSLALECKSLRTDQEALKQNRELPDGFASYSPAIWDAVVQSLDRGNLQVAKAALVGINDLTGLEKIKINAEDIHTKERSGFNVKLGRITHLVCQIIERINDFNPGDLDRLFRHSDTATALVASLFSPDTNLYEAGVGLLKNLSSESARKEAIGHLLSTFLEVTLNAFSWAIRRIGRNGTFASCPRMLRTSTDVLDVLCDSQNGLLRTRVLRGLAEIKAVEKFWEYQWEGLRVIYAMTETWGRAKVAEAPVLKEFCRDTMQFSQRLFDQYDTFANAIGAATPVKKEEGSLAIQDETTGQELLQHPAKVMEAMVKWLRLRDPFLIEISVDLTIGVLNRLTELKMNLAEEPCDFLGQIVSGTSQARSNLKPQEKAELARSLEAHVGRSIMGGNFESEINDLSSDRSREPSVVAIQKSKKGTIDLDTWRSKAKSADKVIEVSDDEFNDSDLLDQDLESVSRSIELMKEIKSATAHKTAQTQISEKKQHVPRPRKLTTLTGREDKSSRAAKVNLPSEAQQTLFREKREKEREAKKKRDAETLAFVKKRAGLSGPSPGEGSGLGAIGVKGKDHAPKVQSMMVSSGSEAESEDDLDHELFGGEAPKNPISSKDHRYYKPSQALQAQSRGPVKKTRQVRSAKDMRARLAPNLTPLHKIILSWEFFHTGDFPPGSNRNDYTLVTNSFRTPVEYQNTFEPLLILEAWQGFLKSKEEGNFKSYEVRIANRMNVDAFLEVSTTMPMAEGKELGVSEADIVLISKGQSPAAETQQPHCLARVWKINRKKATMEITYRANVGNGLVGAMVPNATLYAVKVLSITPLEREYGALLGLQYFDLCDEIIGARPSPLLDYSEKQLLPLVTNYSINVAQAKAIKSAVDNDAFTLIQGPPGSGKTKTIVAIVGALLTGNFADRGVPITRPPSGNAASQRLAAKKLLVCAPSNAAVDELVMRFKEGVKTIDGTSQKLSVIRLGRSDAINANVIDVTLEELVNARLNLASGKKNASGDDIHKLMTLHKTTSEELNLLRAQVDELKASGKPVSSDQDRNFEVLKRRKQQLSNQIDAARDSGDIVAREIELSRRRVQQEILDNAHVICATLSASGHEIFQGLNIEFETVIIDEAAQSIELSALIPLKYGCSKCILVGDPKQLPPTVLSREAARFQYEQSLFVRMQENHAKDVHLLDTQYRMHPEISQFPSKAFYDARLLDGPNMADLRSRPWHQSQLLGPYRFFDVSGQHQSAPRGHSLINLAEVEVAMNLFNRLVTDCKGYEFRGKVGIITPYKSQLRELRSRFAQRYGETVFADVEFNTTDAFQGRESEVIIFSCVRASSGKGIGFLSDIRRMNVGITRAKCSLWVLGNSQSLMQGDFWSRLIQDARSRRCYTNGDLSNVLKKPLLHLKSSPSTTKQKGSPLASPQDIDMPDAPILNKSNDERSGQSLAIISKPNSSNAVDGAAYLPAGGANGLNPNSNCQKCGSFAHFTHLCENPDVASGREGQCFRCGGKGHTKTFCPADRCLTCGDFGHTQKICTSTKFLTNKEKMRIGRQEAEHNIMLQRAPEMHRKRQLGDHDRQVPIVYSTSTTPPSEHDTKILTNEKQNIGEKRRRGSSPPLHAAKGPKIVKDSQRNKQQPHAKLSSSSYHRLSELPNGIQSRNHPEASLQQNILGRPQQAKSIDETSQGGHDSRGNLGASQVGIHHRPQVDIDRSANASINGHEPVYSAQEKHGGGSENKPGTIIKTGEGPIGAPTRPLPTPNIARVPKKRKEADPFIRPKKRP